MRRLAFLSLLPGLFAMYVPTCTPEVRPTMMPWEAPLVSLWQRPTDLQDRDLFYGPWGAARAPDPDATYTLATRKGKGVNPGVTVVAADGREWSVKQAASNGQNAEGPVEVTLSRVLSAVGYHQPAVYYLPHFTIREGNTERTEPGGRFRLHDRMVKERGPWSWQQNPFVGMRPYQGLIAIMMMFNSSDIKNENNSIYEVQVGDRVETWYVVRDLGTALGETARIAPVRSDVELFEQHPFIEGIENGYVKFSYHGYHQEVVRNRITPDDVRWASDLLAGLTDRQWNDAFRAGGFTPDHADRFIRRLKQKIAEGRQLGDGDNQ